LNSVEIINLEWYKDNIDNNTENNINIISCVIAGYEYLLANKIIDSLITIELQIASEIINDIIIAIENKLHLKKCQKIK